MNNYKVYCHTNMINGKRYVGITSVEPERRWKNGLGYKANKHFYRAIEKYGWDSFRHDILFDGLNEVQAYQKEIELIKNWHLTDERYGYNNTEGGEHGLMSEHTKAKMSEAQSGEKGYWYGKSLSDETKRKMSLAKQGRIPKATPTRSVLWVDTGYIFSSIAEASRETGYSISLIHKLCNHRNKRVNSLHFEYYSGDLA